MQNTIAAAAVSRLAALANEEGKDFQVITNPDLTESAEQSVAFHVGDFGFEIFTQPEGKMIYWFDGAEMSESQWSALMDG